MSDPKQLEMLNIGTPIETYPELNDLRVKREDQACKEPGPQFSKTRGVYRHIATKVAEGVQLFGVLDTYHSQAGHAVARACQILGVHCINFYPEYKGEPGHREPQARAAELGADLFGLKAGMSAVLWNQARATLRKVDPDAYMMPNALKLTESVEETAAEVCENAASADVILIAVSSATIAAGVIAGCVGLAPTKWPRFILHMGYSRSKKQLETYVRDKVLGALEGIPPEPWPEIELIDEGYSYKQTARKILDLPFPCNHYYDMKTMDWWMREGRKRFPNEDVLLWNIG